MQAKKIVLITGVSSGFGRATASYLASLGYVVYGTSRQDIVDLEGVQLLFADVCNNDSVLDVVDAVIYREGRIDVLINNAGMGIAGSVEDCSMEDIQSQLDTNFLGTVRMCKAVLPYMRAQNSGIIINISSLASLIQLPFQAFYSAGKSAIDGFSNALRYEVKPWNINIVTINPGDFSTGFTANRRFADNAMQADSAYLYQMCKTFDIYEADEVNGLHPEKLAKLVARVIEKRRPRFTYLLGKREQKMAVLLKRILPPLMFHAAISSYYKIEKKQQRYNPQELLNKRLHLHKARKQAKKALAANNISIHKQLPEHDNGNASV